MDSRRLTIFPRATNGVENANPINRKGGSTEPRAPKRRLYSEDGLIERKLPKPTLTLRAKRKIFIPLNEDPGRHYQCIHIVDPEGERPYCLAQDIASGATENAYRVVMIRRSPDKSVYGLEDPNPNLLNVVSVFSFQGSLFTVFDRPGLPLSEIAVSHSPPLGLAQVRTTLSGICALYTAGLCLPSISVEDITISESNGRVKVALDRASLQETVADDKAVAFGTMLENLVSVVPGSSTLQQSQDLLAFIHHAAEKSYQELKRDSFLKNALPTASLIPFVLNAQVIVFPVEHVTESVITDLGTS
ncbi:hypothetical protein COCSADRAFT_24519 [Bipolaris sorokiniana ND90Pr]|uniref:Protein kinase domain-containing protein n=1 Tax=Cochliobolus sativus (strain ND90Pr / ATCC 201652) TaxID=665912 RepID=M2TC51_COCSN|nr:uncharacterized protein COCSADRAFT_24519 [Bipolaris sorokiniana ND90Pr]EMD66407.1 hypothetical protein COCSADRAFT_24519 [Bipolaris sorokiniana ND90Pr]